MTAPFTDLLTTVDAAKILGLSPDMVRVLARDGNLIAVGKTASGVRLFRRNDVEDLAEERAGVRHRKHIVQFYDDTGFLVDTVGEFLGAGLRTGAPAIVIATPDHSAAILSRLTNQGFEPNELTRQGRLTLLDASDTLARLLENGAIDPERFQHVIGELVADRAASHQKNTLRAFGEMVNVLSNDGQPSAALALEKLWHELCERIPFRLLCAYSMENFASAHQVKLFEAVCDAHTQVRPTEAFDGGNDEGRLRHVAMLQQRTRAFESALEERRKTEGKRVLLVDDNEDAAMLLADFLRLRGFSVEVAHDGATALETARRFRPMVALLDLGLPAMDGYELSSELRKIFSDDSLRLVAITGYGQASDRARTLAAGFAAHLVKPVDLDGLVDLVAQ